MFRYAGRFVAIKLVLPLTILLLPFSSAHAKKPMTEATALLLMAEAQQLISALEGRPELPKVFDGAGKVTSNKYIQRSFPTEQEVSRKGSESNDTTLEELEPYWHNAKKK
jgi:hypothetical protein